MSSGQTFATLCAPEVTLKERLERSGDQWDLVSGFSVTSVF